MNKDLKEKAIDIKGKKYVLVSDRVIYFNEQYPDGSIITKLISEPNAETVVVKAVIRPNDKQTFTGYSQATWGEGMVNKTSALENAETSAVGRALAFMGIGVIDSIVSVDEIKKSTYNVKPINKEVNIKTEIFTLAKELADKVDPIVDLTKLPILEGFIFGQTKLKLIEENYQEIVDRLEIRLEEVKNNE